MTTIHPEILLLCIALFPACTGKSGTDLPSSHQMAYERAVDEMRMVLKHPDAAEWPTMDKVHIHESNDTINVMFTVLASNSFGVKDKALALLDFTVDSCAHLVGGFVADVRVEPDPKDRPCDPMALMDWKAARMEADIDAIRASRDSIMNRLSTSRSR